ncbi:hypothetical protein T484DRAFT_1886849, partial [Baffinella frigidus]
MTAANIYARNGNETAWTVLADFSETGVDSSAATSQVALLHATGFSHYALVVSELQGGGTECHALTLERWILNGYETSGGYTRAFDASGTSIVDVSGNGIRGALTGTATLVASGGGGASTAFDVPHYQGSAGLRALWPEQSVPSTWTMCAVQRYTGGTGRRILSCAGSPSNSRNWLFGVHGGKRGVAFYDGWVQENPIGTTTDWV